MKLVTSVYHCRLQSFSRLFRLPDVRNKLKLRDAKNDKSSGWNSLF